MSSSTSSIIESQILHTTTTRTLHAQNFTRSSTQATRVLTGVLSRYLSLLAETCAHHAQHAGRTAVTVRDALEALEEIGVSIEELYEYVEGEARELVRYTGQTARRAEELAELRLGLAEGLRQDFSDAIQLVYAPVSDVLQERPDQNDKEGSETQVESPQVLEEIISQERGRDVEMTFDLPRTPESPVSPPYTRKRLRTSSWKPPEYVPDFLPPFPNAGSPPRSPSRHVTTSLVHVPMVSSSLGSLEPEPQLNTQRQPPPPPRPPSPVLPTSTSTSSSYLTSIPYEHSSLASVPEWHLPNALPDTSLSIPTSTLPALLSSHSFLQSSSLSAPSLQTPNPARHGLAIMLLGISSRAYAPAATLFASSNTMTSIPRRAAPLPAHATPLDKHGRANFAIGAERGKLPVPPPDWHGRSVAGPMAIVDSSVVQGSRLPALARTILPPSIVARSASLVPPPPLERNNQKLLYGPPVPAPWNSTTGAGEGKGGKKEKDDDDEEDKVLSDAHLFATWDYDPKDFRMGLPAPRRGSKMGGSAIGNGTLSNVKRNRSQSSLLTRRGNEASSATMRIPVKIERSVLASEAAE